ncbi:DUF421 domain-containing protein [Paenibacillus sp. HB172176]|uniref:DUF421 domain-containing protein n=1 Tax=Paenibacillus sp. HB172176 TaxID=2493690 RepID=UPI00143A0EFA|nr:DUF421 domain-containing protein [Paenibacillus sp. HB172176]
MPDWLQIVLRTMVAIVILFVLTKLLGKRQISELSLFEYITGISIGNIAAYISLDLDNLWYLGLISLVVWVTVSVGIEFVTMKNKRIRDFVDGKGTVLIKDGQLDKKSLHKERMTLDELLEQLRKKDVFRVADVEFAVMEASGELNVMLKKEYQPVTADLLGWKVSEEKPPVTVVMDGQTLQDELQAAGKNEGWLLHELKKNHMKLREVFLAQIDDNNQLIIQTTNGKIIPAPKQMKAADRIFQMTSQLEAELKQLEQSSTNESDRKKYESALKHLQIGIDGMKPKN